MHPSAEFLRPEAPVHAPLLIPGGLKGGCGHAAKPTADVRRAPGAKAGLHFGGLVRVRGIPVGLRIEDSLGCLVDQDQGGVVSKMGTLYGGSPLWITCHSA